MTRTQLVQEAINGVRNVRRRERLRSKFSSNPTKLMDRLAAKCDEMDSSDCDDLSDCLMGKDVGAIDPEKLKRWIEILKILLPLILAFL